jgi:hypothetical protein
MKTVGRNYTWACLVVDFGQNWEGIWNIWLPTVSLTLTKLSGVLFSSRYPNLVCLVGCGFLKTRILDTDFRTSIFTWFELQGFFTYTQCVHLFDLSFLLKNDFIQKSNILSVINILCGILLIHSQHDLVEFVVCFVWLRFFFFHWLCYPGWDWTSSSLVLITWN